MTGRKQAAIPGEDDWVVSIERPEERCDHPWEYWTLDRILAVAKASGQARIQHKLAATGWMHLQSRIGQVDRGANVLDVGCGLGFVADMLACDGRVVVGLDVIPAMIEVSRERGPVHETTRRGSYHPVLASAQHAPFRSGSFQVAVSVSAMQWVRQEDEIASLGQELHRVLASKGVMSIHFFPKSRAAMMTFGTTLRDQGFEGGILIDNADNPRKRRVYLVAGKKERKP